MWYFMQGGQQTGPISDADFRQMIASGQVNALTMIWKEGMANWVQAGSVPELAGAFPTAGQPTGQSAGMPPAPGAYAPAAANIPDYLIWSIVETLCCCQPFGIVAIVFSIQANSAKTYGRFDEAAQKAHTAKQFVIWGFVLGAIAWITMIALQMFMGVIEVSGNAGNM